MIDGAPFGQPNHQVAYVTPSEKNASTEEHIDGRNTQSHTRSEKTGPFRKECHKGSSRLLNVHQINETFIDFSR
jgi:hypothetical protein